MNQGTQKNIAAKLDEFEKQLKLDFKDGWLVQLYAYLVIQY